MSLWCKAWWMDGWWVRTMSHCFGSQSSTGKMCMYHGAEWWSRLPKSRQSWTCQTQDWAESGQNALTKNGWEILRKRRRRQENCWSKKPRWALSSVEVLKVLKWTGELERRMISAELAALPKILLSWSLKTCFRSRVQGYPLFPTFTAAMPLSMLEWMVTTCFGFNCKQRNAE